MNSNIFVNQSFSKFSLNMECIARELETLIISDRNSLNNELWPTCTKTVQQLFVPQQAVGLQRLCIEEDFKDHKSCLNKNMENVNTMVHHIVQCCDNKTLQIDLDSPVVKTFSINLILLIGENHEKNIWNTLESVQIAEKLLNYSCKLFNCANISQYLIRNGNFKLAIDALRPKLLQGVWRTFPGAIASYKWLIRVVENPILYDHFYDVIPTTLILIDDCMDDNVLIGLECLNKILQHAHMRRGLIDTGYANVIYEALKKLMHLKEVQCILLLYSCFTNLLETIEFHDSSINLYSWTRRDDVLETFLDRMELTSDSELRYAYMISLPQLLTNLGCIKWSKRLIRIMSEYCDNYTELRTLKATFQTVKTFLLMFHLRVAANCVPLYVTLLKRYIDLSEFPPFDKEIIENLEDCISLLYKLSPTIGSSVFDNGRMPSNILQNLQLALLSDTKYLN